MAHKPRLRHGEESAQATSRRIPEGSPRASNTESVTPAGARASKLTAVDEPVERRWDSALLLPILLVLLGTLAGIGAKLYSNSVWDDAYVFVRYARNLLAHGAVSWNPAGDPTYGTTAPMYLVVVVPLEWILRSDAAVVAAAASLLCGLVFLGVLWHLLDRHIETNSTIVRRCAVFFVGTVVLWSIHPLAEHFVSGMDTTFALLYATTYLLAVKHDERNEDRRSLLLVGILGGLGFWARPDIMIFSVSVPLAMLLVGREPRRRAWLRLGITLAVAGLLVLVSWLYFASPLPLSFYAKSTKLYEDTVYAAHRNDPRFELIRFCRAYWPLAGFILMRLGLVAVRRARPFSPVEIGLLAGTVLFIVYYAGFVLQISALHQRFYYPTLPALAFLGAQSAAALLERLPRLRQILWRRREGIALTVALALTAIPGLIVQLRQMQTARRSAPLFVHNSAREHYRTTWISRTWFRLHLFSELPDDLVMAMTEFGYPAVMNPGKTIIDLTGLNHTEFAHHGFSADILFRQQPPDLIFMPWRDYSRMLAQIRTHPEFLDDYQYFSPRQLGTAMGLALRRSSKHYPRMLEIVLGGQAR